MDEISEIHTEFRNLMQTSKGKMMMYSVLVLLAVSFVSFLISIVMFDGTFMFNVAVLIGNTAGSILLIWMYFAWIVASYRTFVDFEYFTECCDPGEQLGLGIAYFLIPGAIASISVILHLIGGAIYSGTSAYFEVLLAISASGFMISMALVGLFLIGFVGYYAFLILSWCVKYAINDYSETRKRELMKKELDNV